MTAKIVIGGAPHSGKSVWMSLTRDALCARGASVQLLDLDKASPTVCRIIPGEEGKFVKREWCAGLVQEAQEEVNYPMPKVIGLPKEAVSEAGA